LNSQDRLEYFLKGISEYVEGKNLAPCKFKDEFQRADGISDERLKGLTRDELFDEAFLLYQYADHVGQERAHTETSSAGATILSKESLLTESRTESGTSMKSMISK